MSTTVRVLLLIVVLLVIGYFFRDVLGLEKFYCKVFGFPPKTPGLDCVDREVVSTSPARATISDRPANVGESRDPLDPSPITPGPIPTRTQSVYGDGPQCLRLFTDGVEFQPANWHNATSRMYTAVEPGTNTNSGLVLTAGTTRTLLSAGSDNLLRPLRIYRGGEQRGYHELPWTTWNPQLVDQERGDRVLRGLDAFLHILRRRYSIAAVSNVGQTNNIQLQDGLLPLWFSVRQATAYMCAFDGSTPWSETIDYELAVDTLEMAYRQLASWMHRLADELAGAGRSGDGGRARPQSWGAVAANGTVPAPIRETPRGPWRLGLRIAFCELLAGSLPPWSTSAAVRVTGGLGAIQDAIAALDVVFLDLWRMPYSDVRLSLYQYWPALIGGDGMVTFNELASRMADSMTGSYLDLSPRERLVEAGQMLRWLILPSYAIETRVCP